MGRIGMNLQEYVAIKFRVPMSRDPDIDAMILKNRRTNFAKTAMAGILAKGYKTKDYNSTFLFDGRADESYLMAEVLIERIKEIKHDT
jgi:hypothetical protein